MITAIRISRTALALLVVLAMTGCTPWATWPPIDGAAGISNPRLNPIPELMAGGIEAAVALDRRTDPFADDATDATDTTPIVFNLPPGTPREVYVRVGRLIGGGEPMTEPYQPAYHVTAVRLRSFEAEVDVVREGPGGVPELVTVAMKDNAFKGWKPVRERVWHIRVDMPEPNYPGMTGTATADAYE